MSIKNIYPQMASFENIMQAEKDVSAGHRFGGEELDFWTNYEDNIHYLSECMSTLNFPPDIYHTFYVYEPKLRKVVYSDYNTKVIHRAAYNIMNPLICRTFISDSFSCVKDRGNLNAMLRLSSWINYVTKGGENWYYWKGDVEKFFYRIDHEVLMKIHRKKVSDKKVNRFAEHYICEASRPFGLPLGITNPMDVPDEDMLWDVGISIGGGLSHMYGNMYLDPLDQLAKRTMRIRYYIRYADDIIVLSPDKSELHKIHKEFSEFMGDELKLRFNHRTAIRPVSQGIEFVGFRIWPGRVRMRKSSSLRMKRHLKAIQEAYRDYKLSFEKADSAFQSYMALMDQSDSDRLKKSVIENFVLTHNPKEVDIDGRTEIDGASGDLYGLGQ